MVELLNRVILICCFLVIPISVGGVAASGTSTPALTDITANFSDQFEESTLENSWMWIRENPEFWSLSERAGYLRIITKIGTLDGNNQIENLLLRPNIAADYVLSTRIEFTPTQNAHEASLVYYLDDDNYVKVSRLFNESLGGDTYLFLHEISGVHQDAAAVPANEAITELRFIVIGNRLSGAYKDSLGQWAIIGSTNIVDTPRYPYIGLSAYHGVFVDQPDPVPVDFDYFILEELNVKVHIPFVAL